MSNISSHHDAIDIQIVEVRMFESLTSSDSLAWVESDHGHREVELDVTESSEEVIWILGSELGESGLEVGQLGASWP